VGARVSLLKIARSSGVVYAKRPFAGPAQVLDYVGRYTHRVAISNNRLLSMDNGKVRVGPASRLRGVAARFAPISTERPRKRVTPVCKFINRIAVCVAHKDGWRRARPTC
jgi:hypothetical protein